MRSGAAWLRVLGPGIMFASACIGVSHLVQSTRAGALAGMGLLWVILAANAAKYPFFEFGSRYASASGESLIEGFRTLGRGASWLYLALTLGTCFFVMAAVGMVTGAFLDNLLGVSARMGSPVTSEVTVGVFLLCAGLLLGGQFNVLDKLIKVLAAVLVVSTVVAVALALAAPPPATVAPQAWSWTTPSGLAFVIALMGWMPSAVDLSTWNSFWTLERIHTSGYKPTLKETLKEFNAGYAVSVVLAVGFLLLGTLLLHRTGSSLPDGSAAFASGIVALYAGSMGEWSAPIMGAAAFSAMFSTCITVMDGYSRSLSRAWASVTQSPQRPEKQRLALAGIALGGLVVVLAFKGQLKSLVDLATTLSFLVAPVIAFWNLKLVTRDDFPAEAKPGRALQIWAWAGLVFLTAFSGVYAWVLFSA